MNQDEFAVIIGLLDVSFSLGLLIAFVFAFVRGEIVSSRVLQKIIAATVAEFIDKMDN